MGWKQVVEAFKKFTPSIKGRYFREKEFCAIGSLALATGNQTLINDLEYNNTQAISSAFLRNTSNELSRFFGISGFHLQLLQEVNDSDDEDVVEYAETMPYREDKEHELLLRDSFESAKLTAGGVL